MSPSRARDATGGSHDLAPELHDEVTEEWYSANNGPSSCHVVSSPAYLVMKRETYPHWEIGQGPSRLRDEIFMKLCGSGRSEKVEATAEAGAETESNNRDVEWKNETMIDSRIRATADDNVNDELAALSAQSAESEREEPNNFKDRGAPTAIAQSHDQKQQNYLYSPSPNEPSVFTSFAAPHLPPATQFPPPDPRAQSFLLSQSQSSKPKGGQGLKVKQAAQEQERSPATFSFSRLQMMVADSAPSSDWSSSVLQHLAGVNNQVQGSPQSPSLWRLPTDDELGAKNSSPGSRRTSADNDEVDSSVTSIKDTENDLNASEWASTKEEPFSGLGSGGHIFDYSFVPNCHPSTLSGSSFGGKSIRDDSASSISGYGVTPEYTCGHKKHYVRTIRNEDDEQGLPFYFRSEPLRDEGITNRNHEHDSQRQTASTNAATEDYSCSDRSTRANASASNSSLFAIPDSRTSSDLYLSPNFPDSDRSVNFAGGELLERPDNNEWFSDGTRATDDESHVNDNHRVYFPTHGETKASAGSPGSLSALRKLFSATRHRVSSTGSTALSGLGKNHKSKSSSTSSSSSRPIQNPNPNPNPISPRHELIRSSPSAKAELEKSERPRLNDERAKAKVKTIAREGERERRVLVKRGRSSTVRPLGPRPHFDYDYDYGLPRRNSEPSISSRDSEKLRLNGEEVDEEEQMDAGGRDSGMLRFFRRLSQHVQLRHSKVPSEGKPTSTSSESSSISTATPIAFCPEIPGTFTLQPPPRPSPSPSPESEVGQESIQSARPNSESRSVPKAEWGSEQQKTQGRSRVSSGLTDLLRRFSLAGPKPPSAGSDGRRRGNGS